MDEVREEDRLRVKKSKEEKGKYMKNEQRREQGQNDMEGKSRERLGERERTKSDNEDI